MSALKATEPRTLNILLVEDSESDALFVATGLERLSTPTRLHVARNGPEALRFLERDGFTESLDLMFLDLNLPGMNGIELLERIKCHPHLERIPVLILTSSTADEDRRRASELGASEYLVKPPILRQLFGLLQEVEDRWLAALASGGDAES